MNVAPPYADNFRVITETNLSDLYRAFGVKERWQKLAKQFFKASAVGFAREVLTFDQNVALLGLQEASKAMLASYAGSLSYHGEAFVNEGPLLIALNHPGLTDILVLLSSLGRNDIRIIAAERKLLRALPHISQKLIYLGEKSGLRRSSIREARDHLGAGGCLILYARGAIEADPLIDPVAAQNSLPDWLPGLQVFSGLVEQTLMQAVIVKGVRHPESLKHPLLKLRRDPKERDWLAATLQLMLKRYHQYPVQIHVAKPTDSAELCIEQAGAMIQ